MLRELMADNKAVVKAMRECHEICDKHDDVATRASLRISSTRPNGGSGSCSNRAAKATSPGTDPLLRCAEGAGPDGPGPDDKRRARLGSAQRAKAEAIQGFFTGRWIAFASLAMTTH